MVGKTIEWRLTRQNHERFMDLAHQRMNTPDHTDAAYALEDEIKSIPGFPRDYNPDNDVVELVISDLR